MDFQIGVFVKRGDLHALDSDDVVRVESHTDLRNVLERFAGRGIAKAWVQQAIDGTVVKFYGVSGGGFFAALGPEPGGLRPESAGLAFVAPTLKKVATDAAAALGLEVWGGDAIAAGDDISIVDFNDWPSFSAVRDGAAPAIARRVLGLLQLSGRIGKESGPPAE